MNNSDYTNQIYAQWKGERGEAEVAYYLSGFNAQRYIVLNNVLLEKPKVKADSIPTVQIDHIVVSIYGIFVVETKNYSGAIYGREEGKNWYSYMGNQKFDFVNPLLQNYSHTKTLQKLILSNANNLGIQNADFNIYPIIAFSESADFSKLMVHGAEIVHFVDLPQAILNHCINPVLTQEQMFNIANFISSKNICTPENLEKHIQGIQWKKEQAARKNNEWNLNVNPNGQGNGNQYSIGNMQDSNAPDYEYPYMNHANASQPQIAVNQSGTNTTFYPGSSAYSAPEYNAGVYSNKKPKKKTSPWFVILWVAVGILIILTICCSGCFLSGLLKSNPVMNTNNNQQIAQLGSTSETRKNIASLSELGSEGKAKIRKKADEQVQKYIDNNSTSANQYIDTLKNPVFCGFSLQYDTNTKENAVYCVYRITEEIEIKDTLNLKMITDSRDFYYYVKITNVCKEDSGIVFYDDTVLEPVEAIPDYAGKSVYTYVGYSFAHRGYAFYSDLKDTLDSIGMMEYDINDSEVKSPDEMNITMFSNHIGNGSGHDGDGFKDNNGEVYHQHVNIYYHQAWSTPSCVDYHVGSEYSKLYFTYTLQPDSFASRREITVKVIDLDTYEEIFVGDNAKLGESITAEVDITGRENVRIVFDDNTKGAAHIMVKDVVLRK